ncbi:hypothetical protein [Streptomyces sp. Isolate_45]|uniref:hypothetical protein n=1 Tax=Streptomyces sp. Isolate_45 TaxID=2950111 RepID=UPI002481A227|nr:hypothetical protein [Streptomyces sp. Isolate_45]MDA5281485.1 hypothetical protein [Streptomyces sp. Isolate_45]
MPAAKRPFPALPRALAGDDIDDGDTLRLDVLALLRAGPDTALGLALECVAPAEPGTRPAGRPTGRLSDRSAERLSG